MATVLTNDIIQCIWRGTIYGQTIMLTHHYVVGDIAGGGVEMGAFIGAMRTTLNLTGGVSQKLANCYSGDMDNISLIIQDIWPIRYVRSIQLSGYPTGTVASLDTLLPPNICGVIWLRGERAGRTYRSIKHIGAMPASFVDGGNISNIGLAAYGNLGAQLAATLNITVAGTPIALYPVVYHREDPAISRQIFTWEVPDTSRVERRRTVGLGE